MKKKKLLKEIEFLKRRISAIEEEKMQCKHCENFKAKTVRFYRYTPLGGDIKNESVFDGFEPDLKRAAEIDKQIADYLGKKAGP